VNGLALVYLSIYAGCLQVRLEPNPISLAKLDFGLGNKPLKDRFSALFNIVRKKQDSIVTVLSSRNLNISFRRNLIGRNLANWQRIVASLQQINLIQEQDVFV
jgi:hypothetical protein